MSEGGYPLVEAERERRFKPLLMLRSTIPTVSAPATCLFRGSITNPTQLLCTLRLFAQKRATVTGSIASSTRSALPGDRVARAERHAARGDRLGGERDP